MPATSTAQWKYMKGIAEGSIPVTASTPSRAQAREFIASQPTPKKLPARAKKRKAK